MRFRSKNRMAAIGVGLALAGMLGVATAVFAHQEGAQTRASGMCGRGMGKGPAGGHGGGDMMGIHALLAHRDQIQRTVTQIPGGVRTTTESDDPAVAALVREHVRAMYARLEEGRPINARDPLFAALFEHASQIAFRTEDTAKGIIVTETSDAPQVVDLIRRHAEVVNKFLANGMHEMMRSH